MNQYAGFLTALLLSLTTPAYAEKSVAGPPTGSSSLPETPAGRRFGAWLRAFNSADPAVYADYINANAPAIAKYIKDDRRFAEVTGGFAVVSIDVGTEQRLSGLLAEPYWDDLTRFTIELEPKAPHQILKLDLERAERPAGQEVQTLDEASLITALQERLETQSRDQRLSGVVLFARDDQILFEHAYGFADAAGKRRNRVETRFGIASMSKMLTAVAIMQLVEAGKIDLQAPIGRYLTDYPNQAIATTVTAHHLLTHTGGLGDIFVPEVEKAATDLHAPADYIRVLGARAPEFAPGAKWSYSNYGFVLLGRILEVVSGEDYADYIQVRVLEPAQMTATGELVKGESATGYTRGEDGIGWVLKKDGLPEQASPAGGDLSTARDLHRFARALLAGKLLAPAGVELLTRGKVDAPYGKYAYGFKEQMRRSLRVIGHGGSAPGHNSQLDIYPDSGHVLVVLTNQDPPYANRIADFVGNRLRAGIPR